MLLRKKIRYTFIASGLFLAGCYFYIFFSYRYGYWYKYLPYMLVFFPFIWLFIIWIKYDELPRWIQLSKTLASVIVLCLIIFTLSTLQDKYFDYQLKEYGIITFAKVIGETRERPKSTTYYHVIIRYQCNHVSYLQSLSNDNHFYKYGDSLRVVCSSINPEILKVIGYKPALEITH